MRRIPVWRTALAAVAVGMMIGTAATPGHAASLAYQALGGSFIGSPATIAQGNRLDTFVVGTDHALYHKTLTPAGWQPASGLENLGGYVLGKPAAIATAGGRIDVFVVGADHALYHKYYDGTAWLPSQRGYESLGGYVIGNPTVVSSGKNILDVFVIGADHALYHKWYNGYSGVAAWFPSRLEYENLGGYSLSDASAVSMASGRLDVFVVGTDHALYHKYTSNGGSIGGLAWLPSQGGYENLGGIIVGQPVVNSRFAGRLDVFIVGTGQALYHKWWDSKYEGSGWILDPKVWNPGAWLPSLHSFESLGGHLIGTPQVTSGAYDPYNNNIHLNVVAEGTDHAVYDKYWDGSQWQPGTSSYEHLGGYVVGEVSAVSGYSSHTIDVFVIGTDGGLFYKFEFGGGWYANP